MDPDHDELLAALSDEPDGGEDEDGDDEALRLGKRILQIVRGATSPGMKAGAIAKLLDLGNGRIRWGPDDEPDGGELRPDGAVESVGYPMGGKFAPAPRSPGSTAGRKVKAFKRLVFGRDR